MGKRINTNTMGIRKYMGANAYLALMKSIDNAVTPPPDYSEYYLGESDRRKQGFDNSRRDKNDEFYTQITTIEDELVHYRQHFRNKIVFCNCDDYLRSQFFWYFARNFNHLKLKKLITTSYSDSKRGADKVIIDELSDYNGDGAIDDRDIKIKLRQPNVVTALGSDGKFQSPRSIDLLKQSDIVVTNPPFSLFRDFISLVQEHKKKFLILGNYNAVSYKETFDSIKNNNLWIGVRSNKTEKFKVPEEYKNQEKYSKKISQNEDGDYFLDVGGITWFTNLEHKKRNESTLERLYKTYNPKEYPLYDNFNAIEVNPYLNIPIDFADLMGVPISFLMHYNPDEFELLGTNRSLGISALFIDDKEKYDRLIIRNKQPEAPFHTLPERDVSGWIDPKKREKLKQQAQKQRQPKQQQELPGCDILSELEKQLGKNYEEENDKLTWHISNNVEIIFGPDKTGQYHLWYEGDDSFAPKFDKFLSHLEKKGCFE